MDIYKFGEACRPLNKKYRELFGDIPQPTDYPCTREAFLEALTLAVQTQKEIVYYLPELASGE